jgi:hypothetical protein
MRLGGQRGLEMTIFSSQYKRFVDTDHVAAVRAPGEAGRLDLAFWL